ncbi:hypothetical protein GTO89_07265 [Heliobacterium gestii]|uniref:4Fe-4S ferredoxin-type domain-containing protein n=1 Tax=Heliomicrobium gestii TaxID=2699 RepID=A0A845L7Y1_HELGE|nr:hypothetical protein [Heliomicrobium gestii]MBM7866378.1 dissimilatory sulfite reductase (desulfoviridin) alpha/beta subunit [Heliomicrobium gestii]MZP42837.1 hypothetical protein [Heliomicrobium gestii]
MSERPGGSPHHPYIPKVQHSQNTTSAPLGPGANAPHGSGHSPYDVATCRGGHPCPGGSGCPHLITNPGDLAQRITALLRRQLASRPASSPHNILRVALAGCPNSCSQPQIRDFGLQARAPVDITEAPCLFCGACVDACPERFVELTAAGPHISAGCLACGRCVRACPSGTLRSGAPGWTLLVGGKLGRTPQLAEPIGHGLDDDAVIERITAILTAYLRQEAQGEPIRQGERLRTWLDRTKWEVSPLGSQPGSGKMAD